MAVEGINLPARGKDTLFTPRLLGTLAMLGAPMMLVEGVYRHIVHRGDYQISQLAGVLGTLYIFGWVCAAVGMRRERATGTSRGSAGVFFVQVAGLLLAGMWALQEAIGSRLGGESLLHVTDAAWPLSHLFMLVVGGFVLKAGVWRGWRRLPPFLCGSALPVFFATSAAAVKEVGAMLFGVLTAVGFLLLGYAIRRGR